MTCLQSDIFRVATCLENLEMSGNLTAVTEMLGILLKIREVSGKKSIVREKWPKTVYCLLHICIHSWLSLCISFWFRIMQCCIPTPTADNNTSTGVIWVTLNMGRSAVNRQGNVVEFLIVCRVGQSGNHVFYVYGTSNCSLTHVYEWLCIATWTHFKVLWLFRAVF